MAKIEGSVMCLGNKQAGQNSQRKRGYKLLSEEEKIARLYKAGKLKGKTFENLEDLKKDLES